MKTVGEVVMSIDNYNDLYTRFLNMENAITVKFTSSEWNGRTTNYISAEINFNKIRDLVCEKVDKLENTEMIERLKKAIWFDDYKTASVFLSSESYEIPTEVSIEEEHNNA
jgi:hypothetical protein